MIRLFAVRVLVILICVAGLATLTGLIDRDPEHVRPPSPGRPTGGRTLGTTPAPVAVTGADPTATGELILVTYLNEQERLRREQQEQIDAYLQGVAAAAEAARVAATRPSPTPPVPSPGTRGPHSDAWWWGVAICEQGGRNDPYYGYFSWMDGSAAGMTWDQQVAKSNDLLARAGREIGPWAAACVAAGYAASPGG